MIAPEEDNPSKHNGRVHNGQGHNGNGHNGTGHEARSVSAGPPRSVNRFVFVFCIVMLLVAGSGFLMKLIEFATVMLSDEPMQFAFLPVVTYLMVAAGYACLFIWAYLSGQFKDIEGPKHRMLAMQDEIDRGGM